MSKKQIETDIEKEYKFIMHLMYMMRDGNEITNDPKAIFDHYKN